MQCEDRSHFGDREPVGEAGWHSKKKGLREQVTVNTHERHGLADGDCVTFTDCDAHPSLQDCA